MFSPLKNRLHRLKQITQIICLVCGLWSVVFGLWSLVYGAEVNSSKHIRVAIIQDAESLRLKVGGFYEIVDSVTQKVLSRAKNLNTTVAAYKGGILIGGLKTQAAKLLLKSDDPYAIFVNGRMFRGGIEFIKKQDSHLLAVNHIELEDYIKGILYHEASHYWPREALKAQAVACRSYAVYQIEENASRDYDVTADIYSQVYGGRASERDRTNQAVDETRNEVLTYQDKSFPAYYHATCAGHTEDAAVLWDIAIAPLKGVACNFCKDSPHIRWHYVASSEEIKKALNKGGYGGLKNIKDILILSKDASGRILDLKILTNEQEIKIPAKDFRQLLGPNIIRSTNFTVKVIKGDIVFEGFGWGHGVGLCQWGAYFMAKEGRTYREILKYYYPQSDVKAF